MCMERDSKIFAGIWRRKIHTSLHSYTQLVVVRIVTSEDLPEHNWGNAAGKLQSLIIKIIYGDTVIFCFVKAIEIIVQDSEM